MPHHLDPPLQAGKGKDPFQTESPMKAKEKRPAKVDPEFVAFGQLLKNNLVFIYMGLFVLCQASSYVLIKVSERGDPFLIKTS